MAKTVPLDARTLEWAHRLFQRYYAAAPVPPPSRLARREFAAFPFSEQTLMRRHASFRSPEQFHDFLVREAPRHVYYSSAYYKEPDHPTMPGKEWMGADLIFDLDADHLRGAETLSYAEQLSLVKERTCDLVDDFLVRDFGIEPGSIALVFSGGRGYHVHVQDPTYWPLTSPERRELVDYIQGVGFDAADSVLEDRGGAAPTPMAEEDGDARGRGRAGPRFKRLFPPDTPGWRGRATRALLRTLERWDAAGWQAAAEEMEKLGIPKTDSRRLARELVMKGKGKTIRETLSLEVFRRAVPEDFVATVLRAATIEVQGETDAPVTTDIHRLIRLPGSLHGGTGFRVVPLERERLDRFDPWRDALLPTPAGELRSVKVAAPIDYPFAQMASAGPADGRRELPTPVALFLVLRGEATIPAGPG